MSFFKTCPHRRENGRAVARNKFLRRQEQGHIQDFNLLGEREWRLEGLRFEAQRTESGGRSLGRG